mgnify:CR=1 FL=1
MSEGFFQNLEESYTFEFFRGLTEEFRINLVIAGSLIGPIMDAIDIWHGRFKIFRLREFPREDSILMLRKLFELSNFKVLDDMLEYIAMAMNDHPFHMQLFGYNLVNMRRADDETIEKVRKEVQKELVDYYQAKLMETRQIDERAVDLIFRALRGLDINMLNNDEFQVALKLERAGVFYREDTSYTIYDKNFGRYLEAIRTKRPREKYIPEFSSEYIVAKNLAYKEDFKSVLVSLMSWGNFDIVILEKISNYSGIGIQVKRTYGEFSLTKEMIEALKSEATRFNLIPLVAWVKLPEKKIYYINIETGARYAKLRELLKNLDLRKEPNEL